MLEVKLWIEEGPDLLSVVAFMETDGVVRCCVIRADTKVAEWFEVPGPWTP